MNERETIARLLKTAKTIAVVGASADPAKPSNSIMAYLQRAGYRCIPVNPNEAEILGEKAYPDVASIPADIQIDIVNVFRRPEHTPDIAKAAVARSEAQKDANLQPVKALWLQSGITSALAMAIARTDGLLGFEDTCIAVMHRVTVH